jgi:membrane-associated phospholipid phosphatase
MATHKMIATRVQVNQRLTSGFIGLRSPGQLGKQPIIGLIMVIFGFLVFGGLTYNLFNQGPLLAWDKVIANTLPAIGLRGPAYLKSIMDAGFYLGKEVIIGLDIILGLYFFFKKYWQELAMAVIGLPGSTLVFMALSNLIGRVRPPTQIWIIVNLPGFPSGHAISIVTFYGLLAYLLIPKMPSAFWKAFVMVVTVLLIAFIGFSRIFTGGHYLTDILAGYAVGIAWSGLIYTLIEIYFLKRKSQNVKKN